MSHARETHGSWDFACRQEAATKALPYPFASAKHFHAKNDEGEASKKYANLQPKYAENFAKIKTLQKHMNAWDMIIPFIIPDLIDHYALSVKDCWGNMKLTGVNLLKNWGMLTLPQCRDWQCDSFSYECTNNLTSMEWAKTRMTKSFEVLLVDWIEKKFNELDLYEQGGVTYLKIVIDAMFTTSNTVVATLQGFFETFAKEDIAKVPNEDVCSATEKIIAIAEQLAKYLRSQRNVPAIILQGSLSVLSTYSKRLLHIC